ncbi:unnamed protein product, partial [Symbiodinium necroappetens]
MEACDLHGGPVGEALVPSQEPGRADRVVPEGYDHLCAGAVTVSSQGLERPWQPGVAAEGIAQQSSSSGLASSEVSSPRDAEGDRPWSGGTKRALGEDTAASGWSQSSRRAQAQSATSACNEELFTEAMGAVGQRNAELHGSRPEDGDAHVGQVPEAAACSQKPGRARTDPDGDDRQVAETLCAGGGCTAIDFLVSVIVEIIVGDRKLLSGHGSKRREPEFADSSEPFTKAMGAVGTRNAELHGEGTAGNVHPVPRRTGSRSEDGDAHVGQVPEAAAFSQKPGRACTDLPDGDDRQVAETLCAGGGCTAIDFLVSVIVEIIVGDRKLLSGHGSKRREPEFADSSEPFTEAMGAVGTRNAELHGEGNAGNVHPVPRRTGSRPEDGDAHVGQVPEAAEPGRARTDPDGDDRQVAETLYAGGAAGGSKGSSGLLQSGLAAEACAVSEGDAQRSTSWCPSSSKSSSVTSAGGDRSWSGGTARVPGELVATSTDETGCPGGIAIRLEKAEHQTVPQVSLTLPIPEHLGDSSDGSSEGTETASPVSVRSPASRALGTVGLRNAELHAGSHVEGGQEPGGAGAVTEGAGAGCGSPWPPGLAAEPGPGRNALPSS